MASYSSVKSGNWSDSSTWTPSGVPGEGDTATINSGHTVTVDVDQRSLTNGLAGITVNGTLRFRTDENTVTALKCSGNISGSGALYVGDSLDQRIPRTSKAWIILTGTSSQITVSTQRYYGWTPARNHTFLAQNSPSGSNTLVLQDDLDLAAGDEIVVGTSAVVGTQTETNKGVYTVTAYNAQTKTVTVTPNLGHARSAGDVVAWLSRPIELTRTPWRDVPIITASGTIAYGVRLSNTRPIVANSCRITACTGQNNTNGGIAYTYAGHIITACTGQNNANGGIVSQGLGQIIADCVGLNNTNGGIILGGEVHIVAACVSQNNTYGIVYWGSTHIISACTSLNNTGGAVVHYGTGHTAIACASRSSVGHVLIQTGRSIRIIGCQAENGSFFGGTVGVVDTGLSYSEAFGTPSDPEYYTAHMCGGYVETVTNFAPPGRSRSIRAVCQSDSWPTWYQQRWIVRPGRRFQAAVWVWKNNNGVVPTVQLVSWTNDPLYNPDATPLFSQTVTDDGKWVMVPVSWVNDRPAPVEVAVRVIATAASGNFWTWVVPEPDDGVVKVDGVRIGV